MKVKCPDCQGEIKIEQSATKGDVLECPFCGTELEIIQLEPPQVRIIEEEK